jgi:hypothetical protein
LILSLYVYRFTALLALAMPNLAKLHANPLIAFDELYTKKFFRPTPGRADTHSSDIEKSTDLQG